MRALKSFVVMAAVAAVIVPAAAQAADKVRAYIPFEFAAGMEILPAGQYEFENQSAPQAMVVGNLDQRARVMVIARAAHAPAAALVESRVVFNRYGDRYFLAEFWCASNGQGTRVIKSRQEREASLKASAKMVLVAAR